MGKADKKISLLISKSLLKSFENYIKQSNPIELQSSKFQIFNLSINQKNIILYRSGICLFQPDEKLITLISKFYKTYDLPIPKLELTDTHKLKTKRGWSNLPSGIWLSDRQMEPFLELIRNNNDYSIIDSNNKNQKLIIKNNNNQILIINQNNVIHTTTGFANFNELITEVIKKHPLDTGIICIDSYGLNTKIGPIIISISLITAEEAEKLQSLGIKPISKSRNMDLDEYYSLINKIGINYSKNIISVNKINEILSDSGLTGIHEYLRINFDNFISSFIKKININNLPTNSCCLINTTNDHLIDYLSNKYPNYKFSNNNNQFKDNIGMVIASIISKKYYLDWQKNIERELDQSIPNILKNQNEKIKNKVAKLQFIKNL